MSEALLCTCGKKFNSMEEAGEHLADNYSPDHAITDGDGNILFPRREEYAKAREEERERRAKGISPQSDADFCYECTCGAVFFDQRSGILHMDEHPGARHLISAKHYDHRYLCSCGQEFATDLLSAEHLSKNPSHKITKKGP